jgi:hypothetical protein
MAESLEKEVCSQCNALVHKRSQECSECGSLVRRSRRRRSEPLGIDPDCDGIRETKRSLESRLGDGFLMMNDGFEWLDQVFGEEESLASHDMFYEE